jgi:predicted TIM-barrel fold metal-dependent hydrolase
MKLIAIEEHFLTPGVEEAWSKVSAKYHDPGQGFHAGELGARLMDLDDKRIGLMDETGVDIQVLSLTTPGLHNLAGRASVGLARRTNDLVAETIARRPDRFEGFAALPTPSPQDCARELERAVNELGLKGAMLCGRTRDKNLDHSDFWPMFEAAADLGAPVFIHPQIPQQPVRDVYYSGFSQNVDLAFSTFGLGWHYEAGIQFLRMMLAGARWCCSTQNASNGWTGWRALKGRSSTTSGKISTSRPAACSARPICSGPST